MITDTNTIRSTIDYICSISGFINIDKEDFRAGCPKPVMMIEQKGQSIDEVIKGIVEELSESIIPMPEKTMVYIESNVLMLSDLALLQQSFIAWNVYKHGLTFKEPESALIRVIIIG